MKFNISNDSIKRTAICHGNFNCLNGNGNSKHCGDKPLCPVTFALGEDMKFVDYNGSLGCNYYMNYGNGFICNCPVRNEIYNRYCM